MKNDKFIAYRNMLIHVIAHNPEVVDKLKNVADRAFILTGDDNLYADVYRIKNDKADYIMVEVSGMRSKATICWDMDFKVLSRKPRKTAEDKIRRIVRFDESFCELQREAVKFLEKEEAELEEERLFELAGEETEKEVVEEAESEISAEIAEEMKYEIISASRGSEICVTVGDNGWKLTLVNAHRTDGFNEYEMLMFDKVRGFTKFVYDGATNLYRISAEDAKKVFERFMSSFTERPSEDKLIGSVTSETLKQMWDSGESITAFDGAIAVGNRYVMRSYSGDIISYDVTTDDRKICTSFLTALKFLKGAV